MLHGHLSCAGTVHHGRTINNECHALEVRSRYLLSHICRATTYSDLPGRLADTIQAYALERFVVMALLLTQALRYVTSHGSSTDDEKHDVGHALPLVASPVNPEAYAWLKHQTYTEALVPGKVRRSRTVAHYEAQQGTDSKLARAIFRKQKEASSLELFFDLFFVANLAIFTDVHKHIDGVCT